MKVLSFGEILWDVIGDTEHLGGAPLNLVSHLAKLGNKSWIISSLGEDERGRRAIRLIKEIGVKDEYIKITNKYPTGYVLVEVDKHGKPKYDILKNVAWDNIKTDIDGGDFDVFCFGTLALRSQISRDTLFSVIGKIKTKYIFYDVNLRQKYYSKEIIEKSLKLSNIVKLNDEEALELSKMLFEKDLSEKEFAEELEEKYGVKIVIVTRGEAGCAVWHRKSFKEFPGKKVVVADTVGAGDAFSAGFLHALLKTNDIEKSANFAIELGGYVASKDGAIPEYETEFDI